MKKYAHLVLIGMKHTGKSTIGALLAEKTERLFRDTDAVIHELCGYTARELFDQGGASRMMQEETHACRFLLDQAPPAPLVIATGGGLADNEEACRLLSSKGLCIYLDTPFEILFERVMASAQKDGRLPRFLQGGEPEELFKNLYSRRTETYAKIADILIKTGARMPPEIVQEIMDTL